MVLRIWAPGGGSSRPTMTDRHGSSHFRNALNRPVNPLRRNGFHAVSPTLRRREDRGRPGSRKNRQDDLKKATSSSPAPSRNRHDLTLKCDFWGGRGPFRNKPTGGPGLRLSRASPGITMPVPVQDGSPGPPRRRRRGVPELVAFPSFSPFHRQVVTKKTTSS